MPRQRLPDDGLGQRWVSTNSVEVVSFRHVGEVVKRL